MDLNIELLANLHIEILQDMYFDYEENSTTYIDMVTIMGSLFYFEQQTKKARKNNRLIVPVFNLSLWEKNKAILTELIDWIMDEPVYLTFQQNEAELFAPSFYLPNHQEVTLFLDDIASLVGVAKNNCIDPPITSDYIRLKNMDNEQSKQEKLATFLRSSVSDAGEIIHLGSAICKKIRRNRSAASICLLVSIAAAKTYFNGKGTVYVYQNSKINKDVSIDGDVLLKATHPKTFNLINALYSSLELDLTIQTPILYRPFHRVINEIPKEYKPQIKNTAECLRIRGDGYISAKVPCGICLPCLQRKMALSASNNELYDTLYEYDYGQKTADIKNEEDKRILTENLQALEHAIEYLKTNVSRLASEEQTIAEEFIFTYHQFMEKY
ncbi:hypothetical protein [Niallia sp. FSL K6-0077]|uniref:hypothetical protein n=1 Tax=Niallia sp. FSL K6-0077 TaxID=2954743 RepID=UPI0030F5DE39